MKGAFFGRKQSETLNHRATARFDTLSRNIATSDPLSVAKVMKGHEKSPAVFQQ